MNPASLFGVRKALMSTATANPNDPSQKIAFDLMTKIAEAEGTSADKKPEDPKRYYLTLYSQCLQIVSGEDVEDVLDGDP